MIKTEALIDDDDDDGLCGCWKWFEVAKHCKSKDKFVSTKNFLRYI